MVTEFVNDPLVPVSEATVEELVTEPLALNSKAIITEQESL